ncbi:hypothetical protein [Ectobacillus funiculus]|uniref:Uncharacterized protein n=1 Tax=Ectobacillus funiculus TaxID=137993 RepID=A0ABV5WJD7_9BACI
MGSYTRKRRDISNFVLLAQMVREEEEKLAGLKKEQYIKRSTISKHSIQPSVQGGQLWESIQI